MPSKNPDPLKLRAEDLEDLRVVSSCVQDALVSKAEMVFEPKEKQFKVYIFIKTFSEIHSCNRFKR